MQKSTINRSGERRAVKTTAPVGRTVLILENRETHRRCAMGERGTACEAGAEALL